MLSYFFIKAKSTNYIKNNFFMDYGYKFLIKSFTYNVYIQMSFFFAEKFMIEYFTRYIFNYSALSFNKLALLLGKKYIFAYIILFAINIVVLFI